MKPLFILLFIGITQSVFAQDDIKTSGIFYKIHLLEHSQPTTITRLVMTKAKRLLRSTVYLSIIL